MNFNYNLVESLPSLAWCACVDRGTDHISVFHGNRVETKPTGLIEGAWNGDFDLFDVKGATIVSGTGAYLNGQGVSFFSSTDRIAPMFSIARADTIYVSNSPTFVLSVAGLQPHATYPFYTYDLLEIYRAGLYCLSGKLRTGSSEYLRVHFSAIMTVDKQLVAKFEPHTRCDPPEDYSSYKSKLVDGVKQVLNNARNPARRHPFSPLATISRGYDSTATAFMAHQAGCAQAITFTNPRDKNPSSDNGRDNAVRLGMECTEYDRWAYLRRTDLAEAEFCLYTTGTLAPMVVMESQLAGRILVGGEWGGVLWNKKNSVIFDRLAYPPTRNINSSCLIEFRLRVGYLTFSPAMIGARHNREIHRIMVSDAMRPWSIPGDYDRPIPRRILEEAGLPRTSFGMKKYASSHISLNKTRGFSEGSMNHYQTFVKQLAEGDEKVSCLIWRAVAANRHLCWKGLDSLSHLVGNEYGARMVKSSPLQRRFPFILNARPLPVPFSYGFTFQWSFSLLRDRYRLPDSIKRTGVEQKTNITKQI